MAYCEHGIPTRLECEHCVIYRLEAEIQRLKDSQITYCECLTTVPKLEDEREEAITLYTSARELLRKAEAERDELRAEVEKWKSIVEPLHRASIHKGQQRDSVAVELTRLRALVANAPHASDCNSLFVKGIACNCWKREAEAK